MANIDEQEKLCSQAKNSVKLNFLEMKTALDNDRYLEALKIASTFLLQLRTTSLIPKYYYELFIFVCEKLRYLEQCLYDTFRQETRKPVEIYEMVQYAGNIVPRLYLLTTVGRVFIRLVPAVTRSVLQDLVEMCRGVQNPLRGLFLRNYLLQCTKDLLPDNLSDKALEMDSNMGANDVAGCGTIYDSIDFILLNFAEMNKLWVRMQHQGHTKDRVKREKERRELRVLVSTNLLRLSQLDGITVDMYSQLILPKLLEQIISSRDPISQEYLMESIIQVFPDEFHLETLSILLNSCSDLHSGVNIKEVVISLINRFSNYAVREKNNIPHDLHLFDIFAEYILKIMQRCNLATEDIVAMQIALLNLALKCYPTIFEYVDGILKTTYELFSLKSKKISLNSNEGEEFQRLLHVLFDHYRDETVLRFTHLNSCVQLCDFPTRRSVCLHFLLSISQVYISDITKIETLLEMVGVLLIDQEDSVDIIIDEDFCEEQEIVAKFLHQLKSDDPVVQFDIFALIYKYVCNGEKRVAFTIPPLVHNSLQLATTLSQSKIHEWEEFAEKVFSFIHQLLHALQRVEFHETCLKLYLQCILVLDKVRFSQSETIAYEFITQVLITYEEEICESRTQVSIITLIIGTLSQITLFEEENRTTLIKQCALISTKVFKKSDQCRLLSLCLFLYDNQTPDKKVSDRVDRCTKIIEQCLDVCVRLQLLVELFDVLFLLKLLGHVNVNCDQLNSIVCKISDTMSSVSETSETDHIRRHYDNSLQFVRIELSNDDVKSHFRGFNIS